ncbi:Methyl farnesoate epoxidase [Portunus trituberculatus]|uniref:Methyl farnesoate epoxidase n=1 Tax=Portunus trituberculatus TaxID=210409 RepID=A0A5B7HUU5_PORTR|nr:Methyl farnesoate epoxidase [Portunus trituberculatus]
MWLAVVVVVVAILYLASRKPRGYPPGPPRLPLVGYLPYLNPHLPHKQLWGLSSTYGPVVGLYFGTQPVVVVNGWEAVKEALLNDDLNGRPENVFFTILYKQQRGEVFLCACYNNNNNNNDNSNKNNNSNNNNSVYLNGS